MKPAQIDGAPDRVSESGKTRLRPGTKNFASAIAGVGATLVLLLSVACGEGRDTSGGALVTGGQQVTVTMEDTSFQPGNLQVPAGATVTFVNEDGAKHDARAQDGSWQTRALEEGESDSVTFAKPGLYEYRCSFHPGMKARLEVTPVTRTGSAN